MWVGALAARSRGRLPAMSELGSRNWLPGPLRTERLVLREPEARDRAGLIELFGSPEVGTYVGGPRPRDELERELWGAEQWMGVWSPAPRPV
ncbi:hypothetical protein GCM10010326_05130 [Streptomyces xanthochromogenes]|uniref:N-acetyltransferase n=1 Tax=Streptomyces xanthochromogenes TaxID=67384 RepID=A0ABQ2ZIN7_9ACTN|nr:hypothetical protein GCM10010326_05130 [Streptomyces xanthochromogenes]